MKNQNDVVNLIKYVKAEFTNHNNCTKNRMIVSQSGKSLGKDLQLLLKQFRMRTGSH